MARRAALWLLAFGAPLSASAATFTVTNTSDSGTGSLRQAINDANSTPGADTIAFDISGAGCDGFGVCTITLASQLPTIAEQVTIDGFTQPGSLPNTVTSGPINAVLTIVLSGVNVPGAQGFIVNGPGSIIRGLVINGGFSYTVSLAAAGVAVRGCFIGTDAIGMTAVPNTRGVYASTDATGLLVGGPTPADRNVISGNSAQNIWIADASGVTIQGNLIGTDATGAASIGTFPNEGILVSPGRAGNLIRDNVVSGADFAAIVIGEGSDTEFGTTVQGNFVGTDPTGTVNLGNPGTGIKINTSGVTVGGTAAGDANIIAFNSGAGVFLTWNGAASPHQVTIRGNSIYANHQEIAQGESQGIDLGENTSPAGGLTENDLDDPDTGPNDYQNFPMITSAIPAAGSTHIVGRLNSAASTTYEIDLYSNPACVGRPQDFLEGKTYLGATQVTTDGGGDANIDATVPVAIAAGEHVTATATDPDGNTSEFSQRIVVGSNPSSGAAAGVSGVTIAGFNFLAGASVTVGGVVASAVSVDDYDTATITTPALPPGSLNDVTLVNTDGSAGTLPNGWIADFLDVPGNQQFYTYVTTLVRNEITVGVGGGNYGVNDPTLRRQMAVFLLKSKHGICYTPPPCDGDFADVPCPSTFADWIEQMAAEGITGGCGGGNFCPANPVRRDQMAVFLLKAEHGSSYVPPACNGDFPDVPCPSIFADWIEQLAAEQITGGCGGGNYCPSSNNTRGQMAVFITKTFGLQ